MKLSEKIKNLENTIQEMELEYESNKEDYGYAYLVSEIKETKKELLSCSARLVAANN